MEALRVPFVDLKAQYHLLKDEMDRSVIEVLEGGGFVLGEQLEQFESQFARYLGCRYALGVSSRVGRAAARAGGAGHRSR